MAYLRWSDTCRWYCYRKAPTSDPTTRTRLAQVFVVQHNDGKGTESTYTWQKIVTRPNYSEHAICAFICTEEAVLTGTPVVQAERDELRGAMLTFIEDVLDDPKLTGSGLRNNAQDILATRRQT